MSESSDEDEQSYVISKIFTQNAHGLRRWARDGDGNPHPNSPLDYTRYEHLITTMKLKGIDVYFIQETWLEGDVFDEIINGYHVFRHNGGVGNHNFFGVAIILSPCYHEGWKAAGARPPITTDATGEFAGQFISLNIKLASNNRAGKTIREKKNKVTNNLRSPSYWYIIHAPKPAKTNSIYDFLRHSITCSAKLLQCRRLLWKPT